MIRMNTVKLTLSIPKDILKAAKVYSATTGEPLSRLVSRYFTMLTGSRGKKTCKDTLAIPESGGRVTGILKSGHTSKTDDELLTEALRKKYGLL